MSERDELEALFREAHTHVAEQPFVDATLRVVAAERRRVAALRRALGVAAVALIVVLSPWLISGAQLLSQALDFGFARIGDWLATPWGLAGAAAAVAVAFAVRRVLPLRW